MTEQESLFVQDLIELLQKHNKGAFVGTVYDLGTQTILTTCLVQDSIKKEPFDKIEIGLADLVDNVLGSKHSDKEVSIGISLK